MEENINLELKDILLKRDFDRLNVKTIRIFSLILEKSYESGSDLYNDLDSILDNEDALNLLKSKIFACSTSIKYWGLSRPDLNEYSVSLRNRIESLKIYNKNILNTLEPKIKDRTLESPTPYTCLKLNDDVYLMRFIVPCGNRKNDDGITDSKVRQYKNVISIINIKYRYIEIRTEATYADRIVEVMQYKLGIEGIRNINILNNFENNIECFKDSFTDAKFINSKSIPEFDFDISQQDSENLVEMLLILEDFIASDKDESFLEELKNINFDDNKNGFIPLLLAGLCGIGISTRKTDLKDITSQPMYKIIEPYINHQIGRLHVTDEDTGQTYSIQVSLKNNSISFKSELTDEKIIKIVREKILNIKEE